MGFAGAGESNFDTMRKRCFVQTMHLKIELVTLIENITKETNSIIFCHWVTVAFENTRKQMHLIQVSGSKNIVGDDIKAIQ